jgi:hypothetical protein
MTVGASASLSRVLLSDVETFSAASLGNGRFRIGPLVPGRFKVQVADGVNDPTIAAHAIDVTGGSVVQTTVTLERAATIRGRVVDATNDPVSDVWVSADCTQSNDQTPKLFRKSPPPGFPVSGRVVTDSEGRFAIGGLATKALCNVRAEQPFGAIGQKRDVRPQDDVVVGIPALASLGGTAVDANGNMVERFTISLREEQTGSTRAEAVTAPGGHWNLGKVQPGTLQISANTEGAFARLQTELAPGRGLSDVRLEFRSLPVASGSLRAGPASP